MKQPLLMSPSFRLQNLGLAFFRMGTIPGCIFGLVGMLGGFDRAL